MASTLLPSRISESPLPASAKLADAYAAVIDGLEQLADPSAPLARPAALAALRVLWNTGSDRGWDAGVARAGAAKLGAGDILLAADGMGAEASPEDAQLLIAVDTLCGDGDADQVRGRVLARLGAPARAAFDALASAPLLQPKGFARSADDSEDAPGWLESCLLRASVSALAGG